jgi:hypothetical protein
MKLSIRALRLQLIAFALVALAMPKMAMAKVFSGTWEELALPPQGVEGYCLGITGNLVILNHGERSTGDSAEVDIYDIVHNTWSVGTPSPNPRAEGAGTSAANLSYCLGGREGDPLVEAYNPQSDRWTTLAPMEVGRAGLSVTSQGSKIYAIGGRFVGDGPCSDFPISPQQAEVYDIPSNTWSFIANPPTLVTDAALVSQGGLLYLIGGCDANGTAINNVQVYNPRSNSWSDGPSMPTPRASLAAASLGGAIYAIGGLSALGGSNLNVVEGFDVAHGVWVSPLTPKPTPSSEIEAVVRRDTIFIPGSGSYGESADIFEAFETH